MSIIVDKVDDGLPISVIIPLSKKRSDFFYNYVLPLIEANNPTEIIINDSDGTAPKKRNDGFNKSTQPYIFFCDDDILLPANYFEKSLDLLKKNENRKDKKIGYVYGGYHGIVMHPQTHPMRGNFQIPSKPFDGNSLKRGNYISTMALLKREYFPKFDESLKRLQDWDLWLTLLNNGIEGLYFSDKFYAYYLDEGITANSNSERDAYMTIFKKHNIGMN